MNQLKRAEQAVVKTKATSFILPMLGLPNEYYGSNFINCYIGDTSKPEYIDKIFLLFKFSNTRYFASLESELQSMVEYISSYSCGNDMEMFVFEVPKSYKEDYQLFKDGKYSQFSDILKKETLRLNHLGPESNIWGAFTKNKRLRDLQEERIGEKLPIGAEVISVPNMEVEVFKNNNDV
jgi:hypothetical protein